MSCASCWFALSDPAVKIAGRAWADSARGRQTRAAKAARDLRRIVGMAGMVVGNACASTYRASSQPDSPIQAPVVVSKGSESLNFDTCHRHNSTTLTPLIQDGQDAR